MRGMHVRKSDKRQCQSENMYLLYLRGWGTRSAFGRCVNRREALSGRSGRSLVFLWRSRLTGRQFSFRLCRSHLLILMFNITHGLGDVDMAITGEGLLCV